MTGTKQNTQHNDHAGPRCAQGAGHDDDDDDDVDCLLLLVVELLCCGGEGEAGSTPTVGELPAAKTPEATTGENDDDDDCYLLL